METASYCAMTMSELFREDIRIADEMKQAVKTLNVRYESSPQVRSLIRARRLVRAEMNRRHEGGRS